MYKFHTMRGKDLVSWINEQSGLLSNLMIPKFKNKHFQSKSSET